MRGRFVGGKSSEKPTLQRIKLKVTFSKRIVENVIQCRIHQCSNYLNSVIAQCRIQGQACGRMRHHVLPLAQVLVARGEVRVQDGLLVRRRVRVGCAHKRFLVPLEIALGCTISTDRNAESRNLAEEWKAPNTLVVRFINHRFRSDRALPLALR